MYLCGMYVCRFMCRPDIQKTRLKPFLDWALEVMTSTDSKVFMTVFGRVEHHFSLSFWIS